jgi:folylpolyglutamate synthase/dihydropteroate synthase
MSVLTQIDIDHVEYLGDTIEKIAHDEIENAKDTIPAVETDSRLGWEPSMEYVCDKWHLEWKIRQVESTLREIESYRKMIRLSMD